MRSRARLAAARQSMLPGARSLHVPISIEGSECFLQLLTGMTHFVMPVSLYMSAPVISIRQDASLGDAHRALSTNGISSLVVTDDGGLPTGLISRTDLLRLGRIGAQIVGKKALLTLPTKKVGEVMRKEVIAVSPQTPVSEAAALLVSNHIHRVIVLDGESLAGVFSTKEVLAAIRDKRVMTPIAEVMTSPVFTVRTSQPLALATDRLEKAHVSGVVVVDEEDWPVGTFTQVEGLEARFLPSDTPVEEAMSHSMLCLDIRTPLHRAAAQAYATQARRVLAVEERKIKGVLTGIDFARIAM